MKPPINYLGGKQKIIPHILPLVPPHDVYTEVFCGGAALLFAKEPVKSEVINDINSEVVNFFRVARDRYPELKAEIERTLHSRNMHTHAAHVIAYPEFFSPVQRAWAVWTLCEMSFAAKLNGSFGYDFRGIATSRVKNAKDAFTEELCARLENVTIENRNGLDVLELYDSPDTFHFVDPPYIGTDCGHYARLFSERALVDLLDLLSVVKGKFMLTAFPLQVISERVEREGWTVHKVTRKLTASRYTRRKKEEWMICNYDIAQHSPVAPERETMEEPEDDEK